MLEYKANRYQKRFYLEWALDQKSQNYNTPLIYEVQGNLDQIALKAALNYFVNRYDIGCRSRFRQIDGIIYQQVYENMPVKLRQSQVTNAEELDRAIAAELDYAFDLGQGPLFRFSWMNCPGRAVLVLNFHHIITDATSAAIFVQILRACYRHFTVGGSLPSPEAPPEAGEDVGLTQHNRVDVAYWSEYLSGRSLHVELPRQVQQTARSSRGASYFFELTKTQTASIHRFCKKHVCTPFITISAACAVVLAKYAGKQEIMLNYPVDSRAAGTKHRIGCFVNNYPLWIRLGPRSTLLELVAEIKRQRKEAKRHTQFSLIEVVQQLRQSALTEENLFNVSVIEAYMDELPLDWDGCLLKPLPLRQRQVAGDLLFAYQPGAERIRFRIDYRLDSFVEAFIARLASSLCWTLSQLLAEPARAIGGDTVVDPAMRGELLAFGGGEPQAAAGREGVLAAFLAAAESFPEATALRYRRQALNYRDLRRAIEAVAARLREALDRPELVGVYLQRKDLAAIAMLGVLGSGCAYVPIDPKLPPERVRAVIGESGMCALITDQTLGVAVAGPNAHAPIVIHLDDAVLKTGVKTGRLALPGPQQLAYVIYTSGSTGRPKGVRIQHGCLGNAIADFARVLRIGHHDRVVGATAVGFDIFGLELFIALCNGACLLLLDEEVADVARLGAALDAYRPTLLQGTPSFWSLLAMSDWSPRRPKGLAALCGGEALSQSVAEYLLRIAVSVHQVYGPTETTIWSSRKRLSDRNACAVIGRPIGATTLYVLDEAQTLAPWGASGELYIGGAGVGAGYHRRDDLSAERFLWLAPDGLRRVRLYRTGDRVCWNEQGELVYLGRLDDQVKIRGHRVELGEIEHALNQLQGVSQVALRTCGRPGQLELAAYLVLKPGASENLDAWRAMLHERLPSYMIPRYFQCLEALPKTLNGKVDRQALPEPKLRPQRAQVAPEGDLEHRLLMIWREVLGTESMGVEDHFFDLGGHSLLAVQMLIAVGEACALRLSFGDLLRCPSVRELAAYIAQGGGASMPQASADPPRRFALSREQRHLYFIDRYEEGVGHSFNLHVVQKLTGPLDIKALERALQALLVRHPMLHMRIVEEDGQWLHEYAPQPLSTLKAEPVRVEQVADLLRQAVTAPFKLEQAPLYRLRLFALDEQVHLLMLALPHILADGWSLNVLNRELTGLYRAVRLRRTARLDAPVQHYSEEVARQTEWFASEDFRRAVDFWRQSLEGYPGLDLPTDFPPPQERSFRGAQHHFELSAALTARIKHYATSRQVSLFACLYCIFALQLRRYCDQDDVLIGVPSANRRAGNENVVGLFTSMLPLRLRIDDEAPFQAQVLAFGQHARTALAYQGVPLESIQVGHGGMNKRAPSLLRVVFALQNANERYTLELDGVRSEFVAVEDGVAKYELFLSMRELDGRLLATIEYATDLFAAPRIERMGGHFIRLAEQAVSCDLPVGDYEIVTEAEATALNVPARVGMLACDDHLVSGFGRAARAFPDAIALQDGEQSISYAELDKISDALARRLRARHRRLYGTELAPDTLIGLCMERESALVVAMLAILKAGGAYVPLDPSYPPTRLRYMLADSKVVLLVSTHASLSVCGLKKDLPTDVCILLDESEADIAATAPLPKIDTGQLAYVIYTSGSTGQPKGVLLSHANVMRLFRSSASLFDFSERDTWCLFHSYAFDFTVWEIWGALLHGAKLVVVPYEISRDPEQFRELLSRQAVSVLNQTPSAFLRLIAADAPHSSRLPLRYVIFGGEALQLGTLRPWFAKYGDAVRLTNMYGITETTVHVTFKPVRAADLDAVPLRNDIGWSLPDLVVLVLDRRRRLCPVGVVGEMYVAGAGLARGYLNQPALTEQAFVREPRLLGGARLYKTGDLARRLEQGQLEYLGRNDRQVKVRGFRIELGEIQAALLRLPKVTAAFAVHDRQREGIVLYYTAEEAFGTLALHQHLRQHLPDYMLPQRVVHASALPLTGNGKLDLAALETLDSQAQDKSTAADEYVAPASAEERLLAKVWQDVLQVSRLGVHADFFSSGGDSLRVLEVIRQVRRAGYHFTPRDVFRHPTIAGLATVLKKLDGGAPAASLEPFALLSAEQRQICVATGDEDVYPLTALQEGLLFHSALTGQTSMYLDIMTARITGVYRRDAFTDVLRQLVAVHAVLRTQFVHNALGYWQKVRPLAELPLSEHDLLGLAPSAQEAALADFFVTERARHFRLDDGPLWRLAIHHLEGGFHLSLVCHHAILDGWSVATFFTELLRHYDHALDGEAAQIAARTLDFRDYVAREMRLRSDEEAKAYWREAWKGRSPTLIAPASDIPVQDALGRHTLALSRELARGVHAFALEQGVSPDVVLLAAHLLALSRYTGRRSVTSGMASHGRLAEDEGHGMLGLFLNSTPCQLDLKVGMSPRECFAQVAERKAELQVYGHFPLRDIQKEIGKGVLFDTLFNFVNFRVFGQLKELRHLQVRQGYCYEETNFALVNQTGIHPQSGELQAELAYRNGCLSEQQAACFGLLYMDALHSLTGVRTGAHERAAFAALFPPRAWWGGGGKIGDAVLARRVSAIAARHPQWIALRARGESLSYAQLEHWANAMAGQWLERFGRQRLVGGRVGLFSSREMPTIVAMLAILKLGAAYVPLDPSYPRARLKSLIEDARLALVVGGERELAAHDWITAVPSCVLPECPGVAVDPAPAHAAHAADLAYVMFTSGSTGKPKGVMVEQAGIVRLVVDTNYIRFRPGQVVAQVSSLNFDAATFEVWGALLNGATLALPPADALLDGKGFEAFLLQERVDVLFMTPRLFDRYIEAGHAPMFRRLEYLVLGGEAMNPATAAELLRCPQGRPRHLLNGYGPTENTTFTTVCEVDETNLGDGAIPIGRPIAHTQVYVLDELGRQVPIGVAGELYTAGLGLARGYLHAEGSEDFLELELADADDPRSRRRRLYRTGDAVRWLPTGELDFIGRIDRTVKLNGYRINLGELETAALACPGVSQCVATAVAGSRRQLTLYYVGAVEQTEPLRVALREKLPAFMLPTQIIRLASLPLNRNGKIDLAQLPPAVPAADLGQGERLGNTQRRLQAIWRELLPEAQLDIKQSFFESGGDSLLAMQLQHRINLEFGSELPIVEVFRYPTIAAMAARLDVEPGASQAANGADNARRVAHLKQLRARLQPCADKESCTP